MRPNSYVLVTPAPNAEPLVGIISERLTPHSFIVLVGETALTVTRREIVRMKPRQRRNYRKSQRGH